MVGLACLFFHLHLFFSSQFQFYLVFEKCDPFQLRAWFSCILSVLDKIWFQNQFDSDGDILRYRELKIGKMRPFKVSLHLFPISSTSYNLLWRSDGKKSVRRQWWKTNTPGQKAPCGLGGRVIFSALDEPCIKFRQKSEDFIRLNFLQGNNEYCRQNYLAFFFFWCHPFFYSLLLFHWVILFSWTLLSSIFCCLVYFA